MTTETAYREILSQTRGLVRQLPHLAAFADLDWDDLPFTAPEPRPLAIGADIPAIAEHTTALTAPLAQAIVAAVPVLRLEQSYLRSEVGGDYLRKYGWFDLAAPTGPFFTDDIRIAVGIWGQGLIYPEHWHEPGGIYAVLAGGSVLHSDGHPPVRLRPGHTAEIAPNQPHRIDMTDSPMIAMAFWKGTALGEKPQLAGSA